MQCNKCGTENETDVKFCKECGDKLGKPMPEMDLVIDVDLRMGEMVYLAYNHRDAGRFDEAILACQGALALKASSAPAHSLLASLYELNGDIASAIIQYEIVLSLDPNSADSVKLAKLKAGRISGTGIKDRFANLLVKLKPFTPYIVASAAFCLILVLGLTFLGSSKPAPKAVTEMQNNSPQASTAVPQQGYQNAQQQYTQPAQQTYPTQVQQPQANTQLVQSQVDPNAALRRGVPPVPVANTSAAPLYPLPSQNRKPVTPVIHPLSDSNSGANEVPAIVPVIEPSQGQPNSTAVTREAPAQKWQPTGSPEQRASIYQRLGKYTDAISAYREAISQGGDGGRLYQQIARCYQQLGQHGKAIDSYNQAISQYRRQLAAGRKPADVQLGIRSCEAGIQVSKSQGY